MSSWLTFRFLTYREFFFIQMEKYARQALSEGAKSDTELHVTEDSELYRVISLHYNRNNHIEVRTHRKKARAIIFRANLSIFPRRPESRELCSNWSDYLENWFRFIAPYCLPRTTMYIQRLGQKIPCSLDKSLYVVAVFMGNMLIRSRCHNLQMSFCLKIAILFCEGGKEGAKEGVTSLLCTATSSSKHRLKWVQTSSQIATGATRAHRGTQGVGGQLSF